MTLYSLVMSSEINCWIGSFFFFNDTATTEIYTLSLHDALPISTTKTRTSEAAFLAMACPCPVKIFRSEEHTSELQSQSNLVCRLLLDKKQQQFRIPRPAWRLRGECRLSKPLIG